MMESKYLAGTSVATEDRLSSDGGYLSASGAENNNLESTMQQKQDKCTEGSKKNNFRDMPLLGLECDQSSEPVETDKSSKCNLLNRNKRKNADTNFNSGHAKKLKEAEHKPHFKSNLPLATQITNTPLRRSEDIKLFGTVCLQLNGSSQKCKISTKKERDKSSLLRNPKRKNKEDNILNPGHSKKLKEGNNKPFSLKQIPSSNLFKNSSDLAKTKNHGFKVGTAIKSNAILSNRNLVDETPSYESHSKSESRKNIKKCRENLDPRSALKKQLESRKKGDKFMPKKDDREGEGQGKKVPGSITINVPAEVPNQKGREGSGLAPSYDSVKTKWDPSLEVINEKEPVDWLENDLVDSLDLETMLNYWLNEGPKNEDVQSMTEFVDKNLLHNIHTKRGLFVNLDETELRNAFTRSNPIEPMRRGIFFSRDALKMANMDYVFDYMFTNPNHRSGLSPMVKDNELLYFADVCGGPGGFSEYIYFRKKWHAKGIGFTLKGENDFKLEKFRAGPSESFEPFYGLKNDGNVIDPHNINKLREFVMKVTNDEGVHFMMADGGSFVRGKENMQEVLSKELYLCQFLVALNIVRVEGHFVCKLFDLHSEFSASLIYLMYRAFHKISIFKPHTSPPANSERYIICKHKRSDTAAIRDYLSEVALTLWKYSPDSEVDINSCVPLKVMKRDLLFFNYLRDSNNRLGQRQIFNIEKIIAFYRDPSLQEPMHNELITRCMKLWNIPSPTKTDDMTAAGATKLIMESILKFKYKPELVSDILNFDRKSLKLNCLQDFFKHSFLNMEYIPLSLNKWSFLLGLGKNKVYRWVKSDWEHVANMELPPGTLIYGEFVPEYRGEGTERTKITAYQIFDGFALDYQPIVHYSYDERQARLRMLSNAMKKWNNSELCPILATKPKGNKNYKKPRTYNK